MSLLKTNEIQNYNGSSLTLTASTVSTSAQLNTGGNISVTGSLNVSDDSTTRTNLGLGTIATQDSDSITVTGGSVTGTEIDLKSSGTTIYKSDGTTAVLSESGGVVTLTADGLTVSGATEFQDNPVIKNGSPELTFATTNAAHANWQIAAQESTSNALEIASGQQDADASDDTWTARFIVGYNGNVTITNLGTGTVYSNSGVLTNTNPSDLNLKENVVEVSYGLSEVKQLRPVEFDWIADEADKHELGFIAQEVQLIIPDLVNTYERIIDEETGETEIGYGLESTQFIPVLVKAIQEQQSQIDALTARISELETT